VPEQGITADKIYPEPESYADGELINHCLMVGKYETGTFDVFGTVPFKPETVEEVKDRQKDHSQKEKNKIVRFLYINGFFVVLTHNWKSI